MIRRALSFLVRHGPVSEQDRWEEDAGLNTFTLAVCVAALVAGAALLEAEARELALAFADYWNAQLEEWTSVRDTPLARLYGVPGYYVRVAPGESLYDDRCPRDRVLPIRNLAVDPSLPASAQVSVDFLQLVRFGLRRPDDALIVASIKVADALLKVQTPSGACWHRYNEDGYGEHDDGSAYDGTGRGRAWPLLCGERGHYELCAGRGAVSAVHGAHGSPAACSGAGSAAPIRRRQCRGVRAAMWCGACGSTEAGGLAPAGRVDTDRGGSVSR
jgi:glucoamylase